MKLRKLKHLNITPNEHHCLRTNTKDSKAAKCGWSKEKGSASVAFKHFKLLWEKERTWTTS